MNTNAKDYTNKKFGHLTTLGISHTNHRGVFWKFKCDCGNEKVILGTNVALGRTKSCGCIKKRNLLGHKSGELIVTERIEGKTDKSGRQKYLAKCSCGNIIEVVTTDITFNRKKHCGCKIQNFINKKIGKLLVLDGINEDIKGRKKYKCICECGNIIILNSNQLQYRTSCGCEKINYSYKDITNEYWKSIIKGAKVRNLDFIITPEQAYNLLEKQNFKCALSGMNITLKTPSKRREDKQLKTASLDRIDSKEGYTYNNIQWVHKDINRVKMDLDETQFQKFCKEVYFNSLKKTKPSWDIYFLSLCKMVSIRSIDPSTKHGCIIVDENKRVLSVGYNGPINNIDDTQVPLTRPEKYNWFLHAEENALLFLGKTDLKNATIYVTGRPCVLCLRKIIQSGIKNIVYGNQSSKCIDENDIKASEEMINLSNIKVTYLNI